MPLSLRRGTVTGVIERHAGLVRLEVDGLPCVAYPGLTGPVALHDEVVVNAQARELGLGSGGFDVLYLNLTRGLGLAPEPDAHVMKLPYTPLQSAVRHGEEERGLVAVAVGADACLGGDVDFVNVYSALGWCAAGGFDVGVCAVGPGIVGTATGLGHGGVAAAIAVNAAAALGGRPVVAPRVSEADPRERHRGLSHHTRTVLDLCLVEPAVPDELDPEGWREACEGLPLAHMGRGPDEDPAFFAAAFAAGLVARSLIG